MSHIFQRVRRRHGWEGTFHPHKLHAIAATMGALAKGRTALEVKMGLTTFGRLAGFQWF